VLHALPSAPRPESVEHGGDLDAARLRFPAAPEPWIDLSTGINPHAYDFGVLPPDCFARLPDADARAALERAAASAYGAPETVAAPGAQALIQAVPRLLPGRKVGVLGPTYAEHAQAWRRAGREVIECRAPEELAACDIGVIVNPNNPDGRAIAPDALTEIAKRTRLVIDESFCDFAPAMSFAPRAASADVIVLRSFGKTFGLAGIRLGFAIAAPATLDRLRDDLGPWAVSGPAIEIGRRALSDRAWLHAMRTRLEAESLDLDALLQGAGLRIVGGTSLFRLGESAEAQDIADALGCAGIHVRRFSDRLHLLRFGLPPADGWTRLEQALAASSGARS
jgi:cobalamin biosynthetic protein CobC